MDISSKKTKYSDMVKEWRREQVEDEVCSPNENCINQSLVLLLGFIQRGRSVGQKGHLGYIGFGSVHPKPIMKRIRALLCHIERIQIHNEIPNFIENQ